MTNDTNGPEQTRPDAAAAKPAEPRVSPTEPPADAQPAGEPAAPAEPTPSELVAKLRAENQDLTDRLKRAFADAENLRKRTEREKVDERKYAITKFARDIVTVSDNFQRAIEMVPKDAREQDSSLKGFLEGVVMIEREFNSVLERNGVKRLEPAGQPFDPNLHQAMSQISTADVPAGHIAAVLQPGYVIEDRLLRPALVVVAMAPATPAEPVKAEAPQPGTASETPATGAGAAPGGGPGEAPATSKD
ncbi:MAG: nucleotide exchange factor GrpE [Hyphomicrobiaceae bacterium]|nr:nucleotide exchange factor GrpE [Hyphomicrobiaceae bacterium]